MKPNASLKFIQDESYKKLLNGTILPMRLINRIDNLFIYGTIINKNKMSLKLAGRQVKMNCLLVRWTSNRRPIKFTSLYHGIFSNFNKKHRPALSTWQKPQEHLGFFVNFSSQGNLVYVT